jgi:hypothetical protein
MAFEVSCSTDLRDEAQKQPVKGVKVGKCEEGCALTIFIQEIFRPCRSTHELKINGIVSFITETNV